jgi:hypothetical protein
MKKVIAILALAAATCGAEEFIPLKAGVTNDLGSGLNGTKITPFGMVCHFSFLDSETTI